MSKILLHHNHRYHLKHLLSYFWCTLAFSVHALPCFHSILCAYEAKLIWWGQGNRGNHRGLELAPDKRTANATPSIDTYLLQPLNPSSRPPSLFLSFSLSHAHATPEINPSGSELTPSLHWPQVSLSKLWSNRQTHTKTGAIASHTHTPTFLSFSAGCRKCRTNTWDKQECKEESPTLAPLLLLLFYLPCLKKWKFMSQHSVFSTLLLLSGFLFVTFYTTWCCICVFFY